MWSSLAPPDQVILVFVHPLFGARWLLRILPTVSATLCSTRPLVLDLVLVLVLFPGLPRLAGQVSMESLDCLMDLSLIFPRILRNPPHLMCWQSRVSLRIRLVCHLMHVSHTLLLSAPACAPAALTAARRVAPLSAVVGLGMHGDDSSVHDACNSWSDTGRVQGPTGRRCTKGGWPKMCVLSQRW